MCRATGVAVGCSVTVSDVGCMRGVFVALQATRFADKAANAVLGTSLKRSGRSLDLVTTLR